MAVSVKTYLNSENGDQEIRRFSIPQDVSANFAYLVEKIRQVYPSLLRKDFKLYWQDKDGEYVVFSSDEELVMALGSCDSGDNFKVFITVTGNGDCCDGISQQKKAKHPGVVCDVCDKDISGSRFKCLSCPDYDLCSGCENKGFHPEHEMLRIRTPRQGGWQGGFLPFMFGLGRRGHHGGRGCPWRQGPPRHGCGRPARGPSGCSPHHGPQFRAGHCRKGACEDGFSGPWWSQGWWTNQQNEKNKEKDSAQKNQQDGAQQSQQDAQNFTSFQDVFDHVTQTLSEQFGMGNPWASDVEPPCCQEKEKEAEKKQEDASSAEQQNTQAADEDTPMPQSESFVIVNDKQGEEQTKSQEQPEASATPKPQQRRLEEEEFQRKLNEAIKQMESMGFNNDSGWLSQLLIAKDFDIGRVIDTLQLRDESTSPNNLHV